MKTFLNVGCGPKSELKIRGFDNDDWKEIRLDIDEGVNPDIVGYGNRQEIVEGNEYMAKKCGFTYSVLNMAFSEAGFKARYGGRLAFNGAELVLVAFKQKKTEEEIKKIANPFLPPWFV